MEMACDWFRIPFAQYKKDKKYTTDVSQPMSSRLLLLNAKQDVFKIRMFARLLTTRLTKRNCREIVHGAETPADTIF